MRVRTPPKPNGYVLAGGKSSRMGQYKALLELAGKTLALRAVQKLQRVCEEVYILGTRLELESYAALVPDLHEGCGPLGGMEAAFVYSSAGHPSKDWNLFMAVDMPFLPGGLLEGWVRMVTGQSDARLAMFVVDGRPQPALCLLHKDIAPYVSNALTKGEFKLLQVLETAAKALALQQQVELETVFLSSALDKDVLLSKDGLWTGWRPTEKEWSTRHLWFLNLNSPEDFAAAKALEGKLE